MRLKEQLYHYFIKDDLPRVKEVIKNYPELLDTPLRRKKPLLYEAIAHKRYGWITELLNLGANMYVEYKTRYALAEALKLKDHTSVRLLVETGADVNRIDRYSQESLIYSIINDDLELTEYLISKGATFRAFDDVSDIQSYEMVKLLEKHLDIFSEHGLEYWEEQKLLLLVKPPRD